MRVASASAQHVYTGRSLVSVVLAGVVALGLAACSGGDESELESLPVSVTSSSSNSSSPVVTTSTPSEPTSVAISPEEAVLARHEEFMLEFFKRDESGLSAEERADLVENKIEHISELAVDPVRARTIESFNARARDESYVISPGYESNVIEVQVDGDTAFVRDCSLDQGVLYDAAGEVLVEADVDYRIRRTVFVEVDGRWFISEFYTGGDAVCEPDA